MFLAMNWKYMYITIDNVLQRRPRRTEQMNVSINQSINQAINHVFLEWSK